LEEEGTIVGSDIVVVGSVLGEMKEDVRERGKRMEMKSGRTEERKIKAGGWMGGRMQCWNGDESQARTHLARKRETLAWGMFTRSIPPLRMHSGGCCRLIGCITVAERSHRACRGARSSRAT
jgi:hypothetical protein